MKTFTVICGLWLACMGQLFAQSKPWEGSWNTTFGTLQLQQDGNRIFGDYAKLGVIDAATDGQNRIRGEFTNRGKIGQFSFVLSADGKSFTGKWWWMGQAQNQSEWKGTLSNKVKPHLESHFWNGEYVFHIPQASTEKVKNRKLSIKQRGLELSGTFEDGKAFSAKLKPDLNSLASGYFYIGDKKFTLDGKTTNPNKNSTWKGEYWTRADQKNSYIVNLQGVQNLGSFKSKTY